ncbi:hypothetical protein NGF19_24330 [Streptomyces sp. RY43-2]|uniref:Uncharacterized protein n=1 Tax=Streptomyces macrolidinus TaxID=2952607 RepID=A0ABT0ZK17_9ACTN|nr:hypothetical protein [Streptomyces macrolidinus]MCN9243870.1 hypothetical protein [Streptomyces macrolidinus]
MTDTATTPTTHDAPLRRRSAGRHRKPRPRRMARTVGGLALAAGALSLVRLASPSATGGSQTVETEPRIDPTGVATSAADTLAATPPPRPASRSATAVPGKVSASPSPRARTTQRPASSAPRPSDPATGIPEAPSTPTAARTRGLPSPTTPASPRPVPSPTTTTRNPAPAPVPAPHPSTSDLCVPVIGLCVTDLSASNG